MNTTQFGSGFYFSSIVEVKKDNEMNTTQFGSGFHFISTVLDVKVDLPIELTRNITLDRPTKTQLEIIKTTLHKASGLSVLSPNRYYENSFRFDCDGATTKIIVTPLACDETRYYVLNYNQNFTQSTYVMKCMNCYMLLISFIHT